MLLFLIGVTSLGLLMVEQSPARSSHQITERELQEAVEWARTGEARPYQLLSFPAANGTRSARGRVYTRRVRLALLAQSAMNAGREVQLSDVPPELAEPTVLIAWDFAPRFLEHESLGCSSVASSPTLWVGVRLMSDRTAPAELQPSAVLLDRDAIRRALEAFEAKSAAIHFVAVLAGNALRPNSELVWRAAISCPFSPKPNLGETAALITQDDLRNWR
jgi:hypothetical protein